jgi:hypothetical protein
LVTPLLTFFILAAFKSSSFSGEPFEGEFY